MMNNITSYKFEELLRPIYAEVNNINEIKDDNYNNTNADILNSGENLFNLIVEIISKEKEKVIINPDVLDPNDQLLNLLEKIRQISSIEEEQKLSKDLYAELIKYFKQHSDVYNYR